MGGQTDEIRDAIIDDILEGRLMPGDALDEIELTKRFGVSKTPIREALLQLHVAGTIERKPREGATVFQPSTETLIELIEVHSELEGAAAYYSARRASELQISDLIEKEKAYASHMESAGRDSAIGYKLNLEFHKRVFACSNNAVLCQLIDQTGLRLVTYFRVQQALRTYEGKSVGEHRQIVSAIIEGRADDARSAMMSHVILKGDSLLDVLSKINGMSRM